ncbi:MAG: hypothetical protein H0X58_02080 [Acidimicrobiia bacterium]|nr:hypothetical protein [Acidimicrobiia bacterium]
MTEIRCPTSGRALHLRRAWPRQPGHLLLEYADGGASVAGQWFADRGRLRTVAEQTAAVAPDGVSCDAEAGVMLQRRGVDRRLPALAGIVADEEAALVVHRPERRAVVRRTRPGATTYLKVVRPGRALPATLELPGLRVPAVLASEPARGTVEYAELAGRTLHDLLGDAGLTADVDITLSRAFHGAGRAVRALHSAPPPPGLGDHGPDDEIAVTTRWVDHALAHGVLDGSDRAEAVDAVAVLVREVGALVPPFTPALVHRDLHDKQILVAEEDDAGLLDLDTLAVGDQALDVANLLVHLELRALQGHCPADVAGAAGDAFLTGYGPDRALQERLGAYAATTRLRLACVYAFRPRWHHLAAELLRAV